MDLEWNEYCPNVSTVNLLVIISDTAIVAHNAVMLHPDIV